jgi:hypothetical protein
MELISTHPIKKSDLGFHGNLFGGKVLFTFLNEKVQYYHPNNKITSEKICL